MICSGSEPLLVISDLSRQQTQNWKGSKFNVLVEWENREKTYEPLSVLAADDPVTCATYAKENDLLHIDGWKDSEISQKGTRL